MPLPRHLSTGRRPTLVQVAVVPHCGEMGAGARQSFQAPQQGCDRATAMPHSGGEHCSEAGLGDWEGRMIVSGSSIGKMVSYKQT